MKTFSRLSLLMLLFLGIAFVFVVDTVHAQQDQLAVYTAGGQAEYNVGDQVLVTFVVDPEQRVNLQVNWQGVRITDIGGATAPYAPGAYATDSKTGSLVIRDVITAPNAYISALWDRGTADDLSSGADFTVTSIVQATNGHITATLGEKELSIQADFTVRDPLPEDVNKDGVVNILDLALVASNFGERAPNVADINGDGIVDVVDLVLVAVAFGNTAAAPEIRHLNPENLPTSAAVEAWLRQARQMNLTDPIFSVGFSSWNNSWRR